MIASRKYFTVSKLFFAAFFAFALTFAATSVSAQDAASFYKGKVISLVVPANPGGGFDAYARLVAPQLEQKTGATVVVVNRHGGGTLVGTNQVFSAEPDGLTILIISGLNAALGQIGGQEGVRYDLREFSWLARVSIMSDHVGLVSAKSPYRTLRDFQNSGRTIKFAAPGKTGIGSVEAVMCKALKLDCKIILGYKGMKRVALAVIQGEVDAFATSADSASRLAKEGKLLPFASLVRERSPYFTDVPTIFEQVDLTADQAWWIDFHEKMGKIGRAFVAPPSVPGDRVAYLRQAFAEILSDPEFIAEAKKVGRAVSYLPAKELEKYTHELLGPMNPDKLEEIRYVIFRAYY